MSKVQAIHATVCYADVFSYPLTLEEISLWSIGVSAISPHGVKTSIKGDSRFSVRLPFIFLKKKSTFLNTRKQREFSSQEKWRKAQRVTKLLRIIPTIRLIGITGGLSMNNAQKDDDIDFFIITVPGTLWITRSLSTILLDIFSLRRKPMSTSFRDTICLNMFMTEDAMPLNKKERDLYSAHEVLQMKPLWSHTDVHVRFLRANNWVKSILPNAWEKIFHEAKREARIQIRPYVLYTNYLRVFNKIFQILEPIAKHIQLLYMEKRRTNEIVTNTCIRFHPRDCRNWVRATFAKSLGYAYTPLDNVWFYSLK